ncbi:MAG: sigma-70 family RNA polymerase sigma factor [Gammaproteobacteria bacterium]|nr:sigma-70 family RNA polymerase sigma factor [Gammaproteobacteria bacterium]
MAYNICKNNTIADDLTQDMYIKLYDSGKSYDEINEWYVWVTIKNIYLNNIKKYSKEISLELFFNVEDICNDDDILNKRMEVHNALNELELWDREILIHTSETSLRKLSKLTGISVMTLFHNKRIALEKLKTKL